MPRTREAAEFLHVQVQELARTLALVAHDRLDGIERAQRREPDADEHAGDRRARQRELQRDHAAQEPAPAQRLDPFDQPRTRAIGDAVRRRAAVEETRFALFLEACEPLVDRRATHAVGARRRRHAPAELLHPRDHQPTAAPRRPSVTMRPHPGASFKYVTCLNTSHLPGDPGCLQGARTTQLESPRMPKSKRPWWHWVLVVAIGAYALHDLADLI